MSEIELIVSLLDLSDDEIAEFYYRWDKGDCSLVGIVEIYLYQCIKKHKQENGAYYDTDYDRIHLRYAHEDDDNFTEKEKILEDRMFGYYFNDGDEVMFDQKVITDSFFDFETFKYINLEPYLNKTGIVVKCYSDLHSFGRGSSYSCQVKFDEYTFDTLAGYFIKAK